MRWRERDGVRWLEAELPGARAAFSTRVGGVSDAAVRHPQPRRADRRRAATRAREPPPAGRGARGRPRRRPDRTPGPRRRRSSATTRRRARTPSPSPAREPAEVDAQATADARPRAARLSSPTACRSRSPGPGGVAMLHCGWRGLAAGIVERGVREVGADGRGDRPRHRPLLLRGRRGGAGDVLGSRRRHRRRAHARPAARWRGGCSRSAGVERGRGQRICARAASPSCSSRTAATTATPGARPGWSGRGG